MPTANIMLPYEVIKYNIGEYMDFDSLDKINKDIFWYYAKKNPTDACDYLCSIRDEQRLIETFKKFNIKPLDYFNHCWMTSGTNAGFMVELFAYFPTAPNAPVDVVIDFLNLDTSCTLSNEQVGYILSLLPQDIHRCYSSEHALKLLPFIENWVKYDPWVIHRLYQSLDSNNKLRIINDLHSKSINYAVLIGYLDSEELATFIQTSEILPRDVALQCIRIIMRSEVPDYSEILLEPSNYPCYKHIKMIRSKVSAEHLDYLSKPGEIQPRYSIHFIDRR